MAAAKENLQRLYSIHIFSCHGNAANLPFLGDLPSMPVVPFSELLVQAQIPTTPFAFAHHISSIENIIIEQHLKTNRFIHGMPPTTVFELPRENWDHHMTIVKEILASDIKVAIAIKTTSF